MNFKITKKIQEFKIPLQNQNFIDEKNLLLLLMKINQSKIKQHHCPMDFSHIRFYLLDPFLKPAK